MKSLHGGQSIKIIVEIADSTKMKFSLMNIAAVAVSFLSVLAAPGSGEEVTEIKFVVDYSIAELPTIKNTDVAPLTNGEKVTLNYQVINNEEFNVTVVGVGGTLRDPTNGVIQANLTSAAVGPVIVDPSDSATFDQELLVDLVPGNYVLTPQLYVVYNDEIKLIQVRGQLAIIESLPISFFNPQLLFLEVLLLSTLGVIVYVVYSIWGKKYIQKTAPVSRQFPRGSSPSNATGKSYDTEWLPESHLKQKKSKKASK